jgi:hypothetical protein
MDIFIDKLISLLQKTILNSQLTVHLFFPFLFSLFSVIGLEKPKIDYQKNADKIYSVINFLIYTIQKKNILGYFELLNTIPHLYDIIGPITLDQKNEISRIEKDETINKNEIISKYQIVIEKIFLVVEKYLNINKNNQWILKSPSFHNKLKIILIPEENESHDYFIEKKEINKYFQITIFNDIKKNEFTLLFEKNETIDDNIYNIINRDDFKSLSNSPEYDDIKKQKISSLISTIFNDNVILENAIENKDTIHSIINIFKKYTFNYNTKIYFLGHSLYGCLSFYLLLIPYFTNWLCEKNIKKSNIHIINIGTPSCMDENSVNSILENNYNIYHILNMKDINIFHKNEKWFHTTIPLILGNPEKVDIFYNSFFNVYCKDKKLLEKMKEYNTPKYYLQELNITHQRYLKTKSFENFKPNDNDEWFFNYPFNTNISFYPRSL